MKQKQKCKNCKSIIAQESSYCRDHKDNLFCSVYCRLKYEQDN